MSETDDTDVLLLIPPNFFLVNTSESEESLLESSRTVVHKPSTCTAQVIGRLVDQVQSLETRLESLELNSTSETILSSKLKISDTTDSIDSRRFDCKYLTFPRRRRRKLHKKENKRDFSLISLDSLSLRSIPRLNLYYASSLDVKAENFNDSPSMDGDISSIISTPSKKNDKLLLHEIDEFLTKVEAYESPEAKFKDTKAFFSPENVIKGTSEFLTQKFETKRTDGVKLPSGSVVSSNILDKYIYLVKNRPSTSQTDKIMSQKSNYEEFLNPNPPSKNIQETSQDVEIKSPPVHKLNFSDSKDVQPTSTPKKSSQPTSSNDSFYPSTNKVFDRASKILEQYKSQNHSSNTQASVSDSYFSSPKKNEFRMPQMKPFVPDNRDGFKIAMMQNKLVESIDTDLLSLSDFWGEKDMKQERLDSVKLEEERLKREHCETLILQLQKKILDQQEKLAVAVKVDHAKDTAITKLRDAWIKLTGSLDRIEERHKATLDNMIQELENYRLVADEAQKKTDHYETELYKALDLAHDYQEKCKQLSIEKKEIQDNAEKVLAESREVSDSKDKEIEVLKENHDTVMRLNKQATDCAKNLEESLEKEKNCHKLTKSKVNGLNRKIQLSNDETTIILQERDVLKEKVNEERSRSNLLERQLSEKQNQTSELLKKCDMLDCELKSLRKHLELQKNELKTHYQRQLEEAVLGKLQEFQQQLDLAEREMESHVRSKETTLVENYNKQIAQIEQEHKLEVSVLEEKQKEEIKLYRLQLAQASERIGFLENKLEMVRRRRGQLASQLHGVMESQWRQALQILTSATGNNPSSSLDLTRPDSVSSTVGQDYVAPRIPPLTDKGLVRADERTPFNFDALSDNELQQYVKLLLRKPSTLEGSGEAPPVQPLREFPEEPTSDRYQSDQQERKEKSSKRTINLNKPPWKS